MHCKVKKKWDENIKNKCIFILLCNKKWCTMIASHQYFKIETIV